jgi:hypothetical protein
MNLIDVTKQFATEDQCLDFLEQMRWLSVCAVQCAAMIKSRGSLARQRAKTSAIEFIAA